MADSTCPLLQHQKYEIYTDGSLDPRSKVGAWAFVIVTKGQIIDEDSNKELRADSNVMEITAAIKALQRVPHGAEITLYSDSRVLVDMMTKDIGHWKKVGWRRRSGRAVKNQALFLKLEQISTSYKISWRWIQAHTGNAHNERCDTLCRQTRAR